MDSDDIYLDFSSGSGSLTDSEVLIDEDSFIEADGRSEMETSFNPNDANRGVMMSDGRRRPWSYLRNQHEGHFDDDAHQRNKEAHIRRDAATWCGHVDLTDHQKRRVMFHVADLDLNSFGQCSTEAVVLALMAYVANVDDRWIQRENDFRDLLDSLQITSDKVKRVQRSVKEKVES